MAPYAPEFASKIVVACAVLHNICILNNLPDPEEGEDDEIDASGNIQPQVPTAASDVGATTSRVNPELAEGRRYRQRIINNL